MPELKTASDDLTDAARRWYDAGCCVVPSHQDRSKRPHTSWSKYQTERPSWLQVREWLDSGEFDGIGVITGRVSGNLELLEIEGHAIAAGAMDKLMATAAQYESDDLLRRVLSGCTGRSAGGGMHTFIKVTDEPALPNTRLAYDQTKKILAETRGEGGFAIVAPTPARTGHEPGSKYEFLTRGPEAIAEVTGEDRDVLHMLFTLALDDRPTWDETPQPEQVHVERDGSSPGDQYAASTSWDDILIPAGWVKVYTGHRDGNPQVYWRRPGKADGISATTGGPGDHLYVFSSSTVFPSEQPISKFAAYTYLHHGGDFRAAAKALAGDGYGEARTDTFLQDLSEAFRGVEDLQGAGNTPEPSEALGSTFSDLSWVLTGERRPPRQAEYLQTDSGHHLFYAGRINGMFGDPETAKSWIAQTTIAQGLHRGHRAVYLDIDHNGATEIAERLLLLGANPTKVGSPDHFRIYEPEDRNGLLNFLVEMAHWKPDIAVIDSLGELMPMLGAKSIDNDELTDAMRAMLKPLAHKLGACVITIDHLPKGQDARSSGYAIGGIAKKRIVDGTYLSCEAIDPPAPGHIGKIRLSIEKDRHGQVRANATGRIAGDYVIDSTSPEFTNTRIEHPATGTDGRIKPTSAMKTITQHLTTLQDWVAPSRNSIHTALSGTTSYKRHTIERAIDELASDGYLVIEPNTPGKASAVRLLKPYDETGLADISKLLP
jgi:hypothetical protein